MRPDTARPPGQACCTATGRPKLRISPAIRTKRTWSVQCREVQTRCVSTQFVPVGPAHTRCVARQMGTSQECPHDLQTRTALQVPPQEAGTHGAVLRSSACGSLQYLYGGSVTGEPKTGLATGRFFSWYL